VKRQDHSLNNLSIPAHQNTGFEIARP